eukprot:771998-Pleurochrysis_carterae.AAC.2
MLAACSFKGQEYPQAGVAAESSGLNARMTRLGEERKAELEYDRRQLLTEMLYARPLIVPGAAINETLACLHADDAKARARTRGSG